MKKQWVILLLLILFTNLIWEFSHAALYDWNPPQLQNLNKTQQLLKSTLGDLMYLAIIFSLVSITNKNLKWIKKPNKNDYSLIFFFGIIFTAFIEIKAFVLNKWTYNSLMPIIFGIGLTPLIQLAITGTLSLYLSRKLS